MSGHRDLVAVTVTSDGRRLPIRFTALPELRTSLIDLVRDILLDVIVLIGSRRESGGRRGTP
jgi:hypothetical protein